MLKDGTSQPRTVDGLSALPKLINNEKTTAGGKPQSAGNLLQINHKRTGDFGDRLAGLNSSEYLVGEADFRMVGWDQGANMGKVDNYGNLLQVDGFAGEVGSGDEG